MKIDLSYKPQPRQVLLHSTAAHQVFYGGAAGGGKSHALRWDAIAFCLENPGLDAYLFRRSLPELESNHIRRIKSEIPAVLGRYLTNSKRFEFYNGSGINFCYCDREDDVRKYQGAEIHWLGIDEASHLSEFQINYLRTRVRLGSWNPKGYKGPTDAKFKGHFPRMVFASNPGGPGHNFLKETFINQGHPEEIFPDMSIAADEYDTPWPSIFIPASIKDNIYLPRGYAGQFKGLPPEMARALAEGDWDAVVGQAIHNLDRDKHQLRPFLPPRHWTKFMSIDWGTAKPFSVGWYCVSDGATLKGKDGWPDKYLPYGAVVRYSEFYGWNGKADGGCRMDSGAVAKEILSREKEREEVMDYRVADSQMWAQTDGPSVQENMFEATGGRFLLKQAKKDRKANYTEFLSRLAGNVKYREDGEENDPMFFVTSNCQHFWRTVPILTLDDTDPEKGPSGRLEDHCYDEVSYALRSRPYAITEEKRYELEHWDEIKEARREIADPYAT